MKMITLNDKYTVEKGRVFVNGTQILVRLPLIQKKIDESLGLNTSGFISGYRGSPLGIYDKALWQAKSFLNENAVNFSPGLNEDLAATAVWGSQQPNLISKSKNDGVFSIWYGKGPGVDRSGDAFKHANSAGTSKNGGVLVLLGDDHTAKSSTLAHQSEFAMLDAQIPILNPSNLQDLLDYGIFGWALSRYSGLWISIKCITSNIDSTSSIDLNTDTLKKYMLKLKTLPSNNVGIRWPDAILDQETRIDELKLPSAIEFAKVSNINKYLWKDGQKKIGIISTGKAFSDTMECLRRLGIDKKNAANYGIHLLKVGMSWPLENQKILDFAKNHQELLVIEEKRAFLEENIKSLLYNQNNMPSRIIGKFDENNKKLLRNDYELTKREIENVLIARISKNCHIELSRKEDYIITNNNKKKKYKSSVERTPYFCSGCPHNTSTKIPSDSKAMAGIGCHFMALWMNRDTSLFTHMGGEGANWIGMSPFVEDDHIFQNIGDGTYNHSGLLAIRASVSAKINITYKILYNDAVAMTGGQPLDGAPSTRSISHQLYGEGVKRIALVSDEIKKYKNRSNFSDITSFYDRKELDDVQKEFRTVKGVTVIIYDQTCATEKRRRRKRGLLKEPNKRAFINHLVCEGCGDCSVQSNCISVEPLNTELGKKRKINQSTCNKDFSCIDGFCPSFITLEGAEIRKKEFQKKDSPVKEIMKLPDPKINYSDNTYNILVAGIGGTGVVTIGALVGMAAHIEKKGVSVLDQVGIAQKGGAVLSHIRISNSPENLFSVHIPEEETSLLLGCDMVVSSSKEVRKLLNKRNTISLINDHETPLSQSVLTPDYSFNSSVTKRLISDSCLETNFINAIEISSHLFADSIMSNIFLLGYIFQKGLLPLKSSSVEEAIKLNNREVDTNLSAFNWGRLAANDIEFVLEKIGKKDNQVKSKKNLSEIIDDRYKDLIKYQNRNYADKFLTVVNKVISIDSNLKKKNFMLTNSVVKTLYKTMAYKDEYEVARLYTDGRFLDYVKENFINKYKINFYLAPPLLGLIDKKTKKPRKIKFSYNFIYIFMFLKKLKFLRNTFLDVFSYSYERRKERELIEKYIKTINENLKLINKENYSSFIDLLNTFHLVKGYGHVKLKNFKTFEETYQVNLEKFKNKVFSKRIIAAE